MFDLSNRNEHQKDCSRLSERRAPSKIEKDGTALDYSIVSRHLMSINTIYLQDSSSSNRMAHENHPEWSSETLFSDHIVKRVISEVVSEMIDSTVIPHLQAVQPVGERTIYYLAREYTIRLCIHTFCCCEHSLFSLVVEHPLRKGKVACSTHVGGSSIFVSARAVHPVPCTALSWHQEERPLPLGGQSRLELECLQLNESTPDEVQFYRRC